MADELVQAESTAAETEEVQTQTSEESVQEPAEPSQAEPVAAEPDRGDLRIPLQEERRRRQELEKQLSKLNDKEFVYQQAVRLGLAEGTYQPETQAEQGPTVAEQVGFALEIERTKEKYPDVVNDPILAEAAWVLVQKGHSPSEAADIVQKSIDSKLDRMADQRYAERTAREAESANLKRGAELNDASAPDGESERIERLQTASRNWKNPKEQEKATLELLKMRMK